MRAIVHSYFGLARVRVNQGYDARWPYVVDLEKDKSLYPKDWLIPGTTTASAALDLARTAVLVRYAEK